MLKHPILSDWRSKQIVLAPNANSSVGRKYLFQDSKLPGGSPRKKKIHKKMKK
jgi:hypothetical protein